MRFRLGLIEAWGEARAKPVARYRHTFGFLCITAITVLAGVAAQHRPSSGGGLASSHTGVVPVYLTAIALDWALLGYVWMGVHRAGESLLSLAGERWADMRGPIRDLAIAAPFWVLWEATARVSWALLGPNEAKTVDILLPLGPIEVGLWLLVSATAGFCEELIFRGYLQRQLTALTRTVWVAVLGQSIVFGLFHAYQGWKAVAVISVLGLLYGILAAWRRNLKPGMLAHGWSDIWEGWLKHVLQF